MTGSGPDIQELLADPGLAASLERYAADHDLLIIAQDTAQNARKNVELTRARLQGGVAPRTDLRQAEQILATADITVTAMGGGAVAAGAWSFPQATHSSASIGAATHVGALKVDKERNRKPQ